MGEKARGLADMIRHLVTDTDLKLNGEAGQYGLEVPESPDRQYLLEDLMMRLLQVADASDGRTSILAGGRTPSYELLERTWLGSLTFEDLEARS